MWRCLEGQDSVRIFMLSGCRGNKKIKVMKKTFTKEDWNHHMARLVMMTAEERGEMLSYEDALKIVKLKK